jgi:hypothetical protein
MNFSFHRFIKYGDLFLLISLLIKRSINVPDLESDNIVCRPNISINSLISYYLARNIEPNITSQNICNLFQALNVDFYIESKNIILEYAI